MEIPEPTTFVLAVMGATLFGLYCIPHCLGMCGPLHLAVCLSGGKRSFKALSVFNLGRIAGYTAIGFLCGLFSWQISDFFTHKPMHAPVVVSENPESNAAAAPDSTPNHEGPKTITAPTSCCEVEGQAAEGAMVPETSHGQPLAGHAEAAGARVHKKPIWRRALMLLFPAAILLLSGVKALWKKPAVVGEGSQGIFARLFNRARKAGPAACGAAASLIPCGVLYVAFGLAGSTLSPFLGAAFMFCYCFTISFFMQLSIMVGTTFGRKLGPKVDRAFPWLAFAGAAVYITLFFVK